MFKKLLSRRGLSLDRLSAIVDLADAGSLAKAAKGDSNRQTLLSRQIKELEDFFGVKLTRRKGHTLQLTDAGRELVEISRDSLVRLGDFQAGCTTSPVTVVIASGDSLLQWLLLPRLGEIQRLYPGHCIRLSNARTEDIVSGLCQSNVDLGLIRGSALVPPLVSRRLFKLTYSLFVAAERLNGKNARWQSVVNEVPLALQATGGQFHRTLEQALRDQELRLEPALCCNSFTQACRAVQTGCYAAVLPSMARAELPSNRFAEFPLSVLKNYERVICLAWNPRRASMRPQIEKLGISLARALAGE
jgi:DNA-binding transcriptional LysR family regulator